VINDKARELGAEIAKSEQFRDLKKAEEVFQGNKDAGELIGKLRTQSLLVQAKQRNGQQILPEEVAELQALQKQIEGNDILRTLIQAQAAYEKLLVDVNQEISAGVEGAPEEGGNLIIRP
jgi:cell fate (sporulation/competence/biofilm development) regulator YlbF (YheA/YmcA/DUF963 family)